RVGVHDNFFESGGDSLLATQVIAKAREGGLNLTLQQLFQHQTIFELARVAGQQAAVAPPPRIEAFDLIGVADRQKLPADVEDAYPMTALQAGMVFHSEQTPGSTVYHDVFSYHLRAPFDLDALRTAIQQLAADHEVLRTSFALSGFSQPLQLVHRSVVIPVPAEDLRHLPPAAQEAAVAAWVDAESRRPFRLDCPPFVRFCVQRRSDDTFNLSVAFHHAILDGWSLASLLTELYQRYFVLLGQAAPPLDPPPALKFRDYVALERESALPAFAVAPLAGGPSFAPAAPRPEPAHPRARRSLRPPPQTGARSRRPPQERPARRPSARPAHALQRTRRAHRAGGARQTGGHRQRACQGAVPQHAALPFAATRGNLAGADPCDLPRRAGGAALPALPTRRSATGAGRPAIARNALFHRPLSRL
ncbi:MAG: hypothetical protein DCC55_23550, partial [Chloroflexi bacterium]